MGDSQTIRKISQNVLKNILDRMNSNKDIMGMNTGFVDLDYMLDGLNKGEVTIIGGRPAMGKSMLALNIADRMTVHFGRKVLYVSLEQSRNVLVQRIFAMESHVPCIQIQIGKLNDEEWRAVSNASERVAESSLMIEDSLGISIKRIETICKEHKNLEVIIVDNLQSWTYRNDSRERQEQIRQLITEFKCVANKYQVAVVLLSQLKGALENRNDKRPIPGDFADLNLQSPYDNLIALYRDEYYNRDTERNSLLEIILLKNRHGGTGTCLVSFLPEFYKIENL